MPIAPPRPSGPPLNALRAFEAAARHGNFTRAADELCVTPGAIAQHIKTLEAWVGAPLFERHAKGVRLSKAGATALPDFTTAFDRMGEAIQRLRGATTPYELHIAALPAIAQLWLSPRLPDIRAALPDARISVTATETPPNLRREPFDLTLFFESDPIHPHWRDLGPDEIFPVCTPELCASLRSPQDLRNSTCLHDTSWPDDWAIWAQAGPLGAALPFDGPRHSLYSLALAETRAGAGVLIGHRALVAADLESGRLVAPFDWVATLERRFIAGFAAAPVKGSKINALLAALQVS